MFFSYALYFQFLQLRNISTAYVDAFGTMSSQNSSKDRASIMVSSEGSASGGSVYKFTQMVVGFNPSPMAISVRLLVNMGAGIPLSKQMRQQKKEPKTQASDIL